MPRHRAPAPPAACQQTTFVARFRRRACRCCTSSIHAPACRPPSELLLLLRKRPPGSRRARTQVEAHAVLRTVMREQLEPSVRVQTALLGRAMSFEEVAFVTAYFVRARCPRKLAYMMAARKVRHRTSPGEIALSGAICQATVGDIIHMII
jgi:hypothetical protein